jgi:hypothetical protein
VNRTIIRRGAGALFATALAGGALVAMSASTGAQTESESFAFTGEDETFVVPAGVCQVEIDAVGANGGDSITNEAEPSPGGAGGAIAATVPVTAGEELTVQVGGRGGDGTGAAFGIGGNSGEDFSGGAGGATSGDGFGGGGGGGASLVSGSSGVLVGAGGGGGGGGQAANGIVESSAGGAGGGAAGGSGLPASTGGGGGTSTEPGAGGGNPALSGEVGQPGVGELGGEGGSAGRAGGGGGGGFFGGGGGASQQSDLAVIPPGGGGGGSSSASATATVLANDLGANTDPEGNGSVTISWTPGVGCAVEAVIRFTG